MQTHDEAEEKKTLQEVNHILLKNILPEHVADHFIQFGQSDTVSDVTEEGRVAFQVRASSGAAQQKVDTLLDEVYGDMATPCGCVQDFVISGSFMGTTSDTKGKCASGKCGGKKLL